jgi:transcriptional regulator with XRE-family HTH domain
MDMQAIGSRIRAARERLGLTQAGLASQVGVTRSAVAQWETGRAGQVGGNLAQIASVLQVGVEHLLLGAPIAIVATELGWTDRMAGDELALIRLYRGCSSDDRAVLLRLARSFTAANDKTQNLE